MKNKLIPAGLVILLTLAIGTRLLWALYINETVANVFDKNPVLAPASEEVRPQTKNTLVASKNPMPCDLSINTSRVVATRFPHANIGSYEAVNINRALEELAQKCEKLSDDYRKQNPNWQCECDNFEAKRPPSIYHSAEYSADFVCREEMSAAQYRNAACAKIFGCIVNAGPEHDISWLAEKSKALNCPK